MSTVSPPLARNFELCVTPKRDLVLSDLKNLAVALGGTLLQRVEGGIDLSAHRNIRFCGCGAANAHRWGVSFMTKNGVSFDSGDDSDAWAKPREAYDRLVVKFCCQDKDAEPFDTDEASKILKTVAAVFDATPCVIRNRSVLGTGAGKPLPEDPPADWNDFYQFDYAEAIRLYTFPHPSFPDVVEERCFECWQCHDRKPAWYFNYGEDKWGPANGEGWTAFTRALGHVANNHRRVCDCCESELCYEPGPSRPAKRARVRHETDGGGQWMIEVQKCVKGHPIGNATFHHVGYMCRTYPSKPAAAADYALHNPHMRPMRSGKGILMPYVSDWDPDTRLRYIVRRRCGDTALSIAPFGTAQK